MGLSESAASKSPGDSKFTMNVGMKSGVYGEFAGVLHFSRDLTDVFPHNLILWIAILYV